MFLTHTGQKWGTSSKKPPTRIRKLYINIEIVFITRFAVKRVFLIINYVGRS